MDSGPHKLKPTTADNPAGHITMDARGRNIWQWKDEQLDSTTIMLRRLENDELSLEPTRQVRAVAADKRSAREKLRSRASARPADENNDDNAELRIDTTLTVNMGGGFNPYDNS
jgi:hypothetical protein